MREEAWPDPEDAEEVHEALTWMGFATVDRGDGLATLARAASHGGRVVLERDRWRAVDAPTEPKAILRGRLEALGPVVFGDPVDPVLLDLERDGAILRVRLQGKARGATGAPRAHPQVHARPAAKGD